MSFLIKKFRTTIDFKIYFKKLGYHSRKLTFAFFQKNYL